MSKLVFGGCYGALFVRPLKDCNCVDIAASSLKLSPFSIASNSRPSSKYCSWIARDIACRVVVDSGSPCGAKRK